MRGHIFYQTQLITPTSHTENALALQNLGTCITQQKSFRLSTNPPFITLLEDNGWIECQTSGSSGQAKIIRRTWQSWIQSFTLNQTLFNYQAGEHCAVFGAIEHSLALYGTCEAIYNAMNMHLLGGMQTRSQMHELSRWQIHILYATPTQLRLLSGEENPCVRLIFCGGGQLDAPTKAHIKRLFPQAILREFYGATETSFITLSDATTPPNSVGKAYPGVTLSIRNKSDEVGEIWVKSPYLFSHYVQGESAQTRRQGDYLSVGEIGKLDSEGNLYLLGRKDRMITIADKNVYPEQVEKCLSTLLSVANVAVITHHDNLRGNVLYAVIAGKVHLTEAQMRHAIASQIGQHAVPKKFIFVNQLPLLPSGKINVKALEAQFS